MSTFRTLAATLTLMTFLAAAGTAQARQTNAGDEDWLEPFRDAVKAYVAMHRTVERTVPPLEISQDPKKIREAADAMAAAMRAVRPAARVGDIFGTGGDELRGRIRKTLAAHGHDTAALLNALRDEEEGNLPALPAVNDRFAWAEGSFMLPCVLEALPALPEELEYRLVGRDLVLVDVHAGLVVDVLPNALPFDGTR